MNQEWQLFNQVFESSRDFVLATICSTEGSTYRKAGAMMLLNENKCFGLLSGGCLEDDIRLHGLQCIERNEQKLLTYDLRGDADITWGLGLGCEGKIEILLQPLCQENNHLDFPNLLGFIEQRDSGFLLQSLDPKQPKPLTLLRPEAIKKFELDGDAKRQLESGRSVIIQSKSKQRQLLSPVRPPVGLLICGAGPDVVPLVNMANELGWTVEVWDHRKAYLARPEFDTVARKQLVRSHNVECSEMTRFDAVVVMTHHLEHDQNFIDAALQTDLPFIGLLGPTARKEKLLSRLNIADPAQQARVLGPVGLDIGANTPSSIALSILSQVQRELFKPPVSEKYNERAAS